ncbi:clarin-3 [Ambystoma mexicanum]|uniref:clarin-3 n=1 Tax=Ambystoma mexicanum TaxID=8296 RepID=UPI0037E784F8
MPSRKKTSMFVAGFLASVGSFALICTSLGTQQWVSSRVNFTEAPDVSYGYVNVAYGLFEGTSELVNVKGGLSSPAKGFQVLTVANGSGSIHIVHVLIIVLLVAGLLCSLLSSGITCYNSVSNPYRTFFGPIGVYAWNGSNGILILLAMILSAVNTEVNKMPLYLASKTIPSRVTLDSPQSSYGYSFWLLLVILLLNAATIIIIYFYQHARYSKRKEQQRPMENAPKDVILF